MGEMYAGRTKSEKKDDNSSGTIYFDGSGAWLYTVSLNSFDLVDGGKHLDWGGETKYVSQVPSAATIWNGHKFGVIRKNSFNTIMDVEFKDYNKESDVYGLTRKKDASIQLNKFNMDKASDKVKLSVIIHEFGHALGLGHNDRNDVMYDKNMGATELTISDKESYNAA